MLMEDFNVQSFWPPIFCGCGFAAGRAAVHDGAFSARADCHIVHISLQCRVT